MSVRLVKEYEVAMVHTYTIELEEQEVEEYLLQSPDFYLDEEGGDVIDYEEMFDYFEARGHTVNMEDEAVDYQNNGVTYERI